MSRKPNGKHRRHTMREKFSSTPLHNVPLKQFNISLSRIDTGSSSNEDIRNWKLQQQSQISEKQKKSSKTNKKTIKRNKRVISQSKVTEWVTESEESINEFLSSQESKSDGASMCINLFESSRTPEKTRDAPIRFEEILQKSPIIQSSKRSRSVSKEIIIRQDQLLPVHVPSADQRNCLDTDEDELVFHHETNLKTYSSAHKRKRSLGTLELKFGDYMYPVQGSTLISDQLWNQFIEKHYGKSSHYWAPLSSPKPVFKKIEIPPTPIPRSKDSRKCCSSRRKSEHKIQLKKGGQIRKRSKVKRKKEMLILPSARRQKGDTDVYDQSDETDIEFETSGKGNKHMSLSEFCHKQNGNKVPNIISLTSSESDAE
ncbi:hypothetical protein DMN91_001243 [Ooceraea biroi]|uniref:Uncharacterized protein n=1 Tax=Ooceraea biroi TaxID=2015173 RepID=A0A026WX80_OOCBI|nr:uncharacterized protein LOC105288142 [Ooceraea biroi]XP_026831214.1 uncharacterized protein LOC113563602 [Ooceraea biroi]EZA60617.1 hypothetical protein X777_14643 [Ooceraea biroi]RLU27108.1 hypothetical protein DMN91_000907 [Ooceraea biroi]RLU27439.1 hypothetical protein DMN91_001243 [Ooceraea biroi]